VSQLIQMGVTGPSVIGVTVRNVTVSVMGMLGLTALASDAIRRINRLKLALHFGFTLTDKHGLAHCNERGRARAPTPSEATMATT